MTARETEALQLARCLSVAHGQAANACAENEREAHVFGLSATQPVRPCWSRLHAACARPVSGFFRNHPANPCPLQTWCKKAG